MKNNTKTGLLLIMFGLITAMISSVIFFILSFNLKISDLNSILSLLIVAVIPAAIGGLLGFIGIVLIIAGRKDYGEKHSKFVLYALIIFVASIISGMIFSVFQNLLRYSAISPLNPFNETTSFDFTNLVLLMSIQTIVAAVLSGLMYLFLLYHLENKKGKQILFAAVFTSIFFSFIMAIFNYFNLNDLFASIDIQSSSYSSLLSYITNLSGISVIAIIGNILLVIAIYIPYKRITSGELTQIIQYHYFGDRHCPTCGRVIPMDANICPYCGRKF